MNFNNNQEQDRLELDFQTLVDDVKSAAQALDMIAFEAYVQNTVDDLAVRGQITSDLVANLLKAHAMAHDQIVNPYNVSVEIQNGSHHIATNRPMINYKKKPKGTTSPKWFENNTPPKNPTSGHYRLWNNHKWYWCAPITGGKCQGHWRRHSPFECKGTAKGAAGHKEPVYGNKRKAKASQIAITNSSQTAKLNSQCKACGTKRMRMTQGVNGVHKDDE